MIHTTESGVPVSLQKDALVFAVQYSPTSSTPQIFTLTNTMSTPMAISATNSAPVSSTVLDLGSIVNQDQPLDLSTPTSRENLTLASSLSGMDATSETKPDDLQTIDPDLALATLSAVTSNSITPLVKEELRCTIQQKRLSEGKEELLIAEDEPKNYQLTPAEEEKKLRRRERNRIAAQKCRHKRKQRADCLIEVSPGHLGSCDLVTERLLSFQESKELEDRNQVLRDEIARLEEEREQLQHMLLTHDVLPTKCNQKLSVSSEDDFCSHTSDVNKDAVFTDVIEEMEQSDDSDEDVEILDQVL